MANLKVFVSSTCYDLSIVRSQLRSFISGLGYEPVMSDYADVLYDPKVHTHTSCIQEVNNCDMLILIIGSRFGGRIVPKALDEVDFDVLKNFSKDNKIISEKENLSITQMEVLKAIEINIPIFTFIDTRVLHDHFVYEKNKDKKIINDIDFPSIDKIETAKYIFEFINFLRGRSENNSITSFAIMEDIETFLKKQWSGLFQRMLYERRIKAIEGTRIDDLSNQIADIKTAIMTSFSNLELKETARGAIKFRRLIDFLCSFNVAGLIDILLLNIKWEKLLTKLNIDKIVKNDKRKGAAMPFPTAIILKDETYYEARYPISVIRDFEMQWNEFITLNNDTKSAIINAIKDSYDPIRNGYLRHVNDKYYDGQFVFLFDSKASENRDDNEIK